MKNSAKFSKCKNYRYALWRTWDETKPYVMFIGLNPSTVDEKKNNPTINRCIKYAQLWNFGAVCITNLFAYNTTYPKDLKTTKKPIGKNNNEWLVKLAHEAGIVIAAWGNDGSYMNRSNEVKNLIGDLYCLAINKSGEPAHPLYQRSDLRPKKLAI